MTEAGEEVENGIGHHAHKTVFEVLLQDAAEQKNYRMVYVGLERCYDDDRGNLMVAWCILRALEPS